MRKKGLKMLVVLAALSMAGAVFAAGMADLNPEMRSLMDKYLSEAQKKDPSLKAFSPEEGKKFFNAKRMHSVNREERSCSMCHTSNPSSPGKTPVGKTIEPMAYSANKDRFTDPQKVEKWFKRNCAWVLERECTPKEKGDFISYMMSN